jgi:type I restriction enzyme S subunit
MTHDTRSKGGGIYPRGFSLATSWPWPLVKSERLVSLHYGKALRDGDRHSGSIPVYGTNGRCGLHDAPLVTGPGVILGRKGQGPLGVEWCDSDFWVIDTAYFAIPRTPELDLRYFYYVIKYIGLNHLKDGTSNPGLSRATFGDLLFPLPPLDTQRSICRFLHSLDQRVELNRRMNETLGTIARAIFKSWFVDFDPVRENSSNFEQSALGRIPRGWRVAELGEIAEVIDCLHSKKPDRQQTGKPFLQLCNIKDDSLLDMTDTYFISEQDYERWISRMEAQEGDCVITNVGRVAAISQIPTGLRAALGRNMTGIRCRSEYPYPTLLVQALTGDAMREEIALKVDSGTILDSLNVRSIPHLRLVLAPKEFLQKFETACRPIRARMELNLSQSHTLKSVRDMLVPKLVSGEIRLKDAEKMVETQP